MSYDLTLDCGCSVYVSCDPTTQVAHTRVLERKHPACRVRKHDVGYRLCLWDLLPDRGTTAAGTPHGRPTTCTATEPGLPSAST